MENKKVDHIIRNWDGSPTIEDGIIEENCLFDNALIEGWGTIIIDKEFIDSMNEIADNYEVPNDMIRTFTDINNYITDYFFSEEENESNRKETYSNNHVTDEYGMIIGTKLSSLKGKNVAECSERSIAAYLILDRLFKSGKMNRKPNLMLSSLKTDTIEEGPHAFITMSRETSKYPLKHLLYDPQNPTRVTYQDKEYNCIGLYSMTDEEYDDLLNGIECTPKSTFELIDSNYTEISEKRTYGSKTKNKTI